MLEAGSKARDRSWEGEKGERTPLMICCCRTSSGLIFWFLPYGLKPPKVDISCCCCFLVSGLFSVYIPTESVFARVVGSSCGCNSSGLSGSLWRAWCCKGGAHKRRGLKFGFSSQRIPGGSARSPGRQVRLPAAWLLGFSALRFFSPID
jgi:hypothetical protein